MDFQIFQVLFSITGPFLLYFPRNSFPKLHRGEYADDIREATDSVKMTTRGPQSLLELINTDDQHVFTFEEVVRVYTAQGKENDEKKIRNVLAQWKTRKYIEELPDSNYRKLKA